MKTISKQLLNEFAAGCRQVAAHGLVQCGSGNLSWRLDANRMLIKSSRAWLSEVTRDTIAVCRISDGKPLTDITPSIEIGFHAGILRRRQAMNVVLHFQTPYATAIGCMRLKTIPYFVIPEAPYYLGPIAHVPYLPPGSKALANTVTSAMQTHDIVQLRNHGQVTVGRDFRQVIQNAVYFEMACKILCHAGKEGRAMSAKAARILRAAHKV
ncbi:MAG: class II aldolase/adducin family protein [Verrucomicrobiota bacterium]